MIFIFWMLSFGPAFSLSSLLSSRGSLVPLHFLTLGWSPLHIYGYLYFSQKSWFQHGLYLAWHFTWCSLHMLNKQGDNIHPWCTPFPILKQSVFPSLVLTVASWPAHRSQEAGKVVWYSHVFFFLHDYILHIFSEKCSMLVQVPYIQDSKAITMQFLSAQTLGDES